MYQISTRLQYGHPDYEKALDRCTVYNIAAIQLDIQNSKKKMAEFAMTVPEFLDYKLTVENLYVLGLSGSTS